MTTPNLTTRTLPTFCNVVALLYLAFQRVLRQLYGFIRNGCFRVRRNLLSYSSTGADQQFGVQSKIWTSISDDRSEAAVSSAAFSAPPNTPW
jgi:hypothetical protein